MHMQGEPRTMQRDPRYEDAARDVCAWLASRLDACLAAGIPRERIALDPGIGFGKTLAHNLRILAHLDLYRPLGCALAHRRVAKKLHRPVERRTRRCRSGCPDRLAAGLAAVARGAHILRVHDVEETLQALAVWRAISGAGSGESDTRVRCAPECKVGSCRCAQSTGESDE